MNTITQIFGWIGTTLILLAYALVSFKKFDATNRAYQWINLVGAVSLGVHVFSQKAWAAVTLEIIWGLIAVVALVRNKK